MLTNCSFLLIFYLCLRKDLNILEGLCMPLGLFSIVKPLVHGIATIEMVVLAGMKITGADSEA